jgi:hypothetical protein
VPGLKIVLLTEMLSPAADTGELNVMLVAKNTITKKILFNFLIMG